MEGLVKCEILRPTNLFYPVLSYKVNAKLLFSLCRTCSENFSQTEEYCHDTDERKLIGTWASLEIKKALELGYRILNIDVIWQ